MGALLLIPKSINASYSARSYVQKRTQYVTRTRLRRPFATRPFCSAVAFPSRANPSSPLRRWSVDRLAP
ncbi:MAG: hypothetical protein ACNA8O_06590 [Cyanobacteriota bacterium]